MVALRSGRRPAVSLKPGLTGILLLLALASGGCSSSGRMHQQAWSAAHEQPQRVAAEASRKPDLEDDGVEAQVPPSPAIRLAPDDPSEPFSPNYGHPASAPAAAPSKPASQPQTPPSGRPPRSKFAAMDAD